MNNKYIGIFDSGLGGLTVCKSIIERLPKENIIYFGDTANVPYGTKTKEEIEKLAINDVKFLNQYDLKAIMIACNTADSIAKDKVIAMSNIPVYGVVYPASFKACKVTSNKKVGVIATPAAINSKSYQTTIKQIDKDIEVFAVACPSLVPLVEEGKFKKTDLETVKALHVYLDPLKEIGIDTLVLGCTHYPLLFDIIKDIMPNTNIISSSDAAAEELENQLRQNNLLSDEDNVKREYYVSSNPIDFKDKASTFMGKNIEIKMKNS